MIMNQTNTMAAHVPALRFGGDETGGILDQIMALILGKLKTDRATLKAVEWSLWEIMDNVSNHAQSPVGGFVQATAYENANRVEFVVADAGIGIPRRHRKRPTSRSSATRSHQRGNHTGIQPKMQEMGSMEVTGSRPFPGANSKSTL